MDDTTYELLINQRRFSKNKDTNDISAIDKDKVIKLFQKHSELLCHKCNGLKEIEKEKYFLEIDEMLMSIYRKMNKDLSVLES